MLADMPQTIGRWMAESMVALGVPRAGWECKPLRPRRGHIVAALVSGVCGVLPLLIVALDEDANWGAVLGGALGPLSVGLVASLRELRRKGRDYLYVDERGFVHVRRMSNGKETLWVVRFRDVDEVYFQRGHRSEETLKAKIHGRGLILRETRRGKRPKDKTPKKIVIDAETMKLHPRLLETLIEWAAPKATSEKRRKAVERARRYLEEARGKTPKPIPIST